VQVGDYAPATDWVQGDSQLISSGGTENTYRAQFPVAVPEWDKVLGSVPSKWNTSAARAAGWEAGKATNIGFVGSHMMHRGFGGPSPYAEITAYQCTWRQMWRHGFDSFQWWTEDLGVEYEGGNPTCFMMDYKHAMVETHGHAFWWLDNDPDAGFGISNNQEGRAYAPAFGISLTTMLWALGPQGGYHVATGSNYLATQGWTSLKIEQQDPTADMCDLEDLWVSFDEIIRPENDGEVRWYVGVARHTNDPSRLSGFTDADAGQLPLGPFVDRVNFWDPNNMGWVAIGTAAGQPDEIIKNMEVVGTYEGGVGEWLQVSPSARMAALERELKAHEVWNGADSDWRTLPESTQRVIRPYASGLAFVGYLTDAFLVNPPAEVTFGDPNGYWEGGRLNLTMFFRAQVRPKPFRYICAPRLADIDTTLPELGPFAGDLAVGRRTFGRPAGT
jgi:hypothetical protein